MKKTITSFLLLTIFLMGATSNSVGASPIFSDIQGHWAEQTILAWADSGIINGFPDGTFQPNRDISRAQFARVVVNAFDLQRPSGISLPDINPSDWYYSYVNIAALFMPSRDTELFHPDLNVSRIDVAETLVNIMVYKEEATSDTPGLEEVVAFVRQTFNDIEYSAGDPRFPNVQRLFRITWLSYNLNIAQGDNYGYFRPHWGITRAELVTMIDRILR
jgi:hypothetical protein